MIVIKLVVILNTLLSIAIIAILNYNCIIMISIYYVNYDITM